ncbi:MAG: DUF7689 domain-containing protein [Gemmataceae bacterium]
MTRSLTPQVKIHARQIWPRMNVDAVVVADEATNRYNCLSWTLGITTHWVWPWGSRNPTKAEFDALYHSYGFSPCGAGTIASFGLDLHSMTHGSISGPEHGPQWESKCGAWLRIQHGLGEMEGGSLYGNVLGFYSRAALMTDNLEQANVRLQTLLKAQTMNDLLSLTADQRNYVRIRADQVDKQLKERFDRAYNAWKATWNHPLIVVNSAPAARTRTTEFLELISLGADILPLLMEKLTDPDEFFALMAVDRLARPELHVLRNLDDEAGLLGEQGRAVETVQRWIASER